MLRYFIRQKQCFAKRVLRRGMYFTLPVTFINMPEDIKSNQ